MPTERSAERLYHWVDEVHVLGFLDQKENKEVKEQFSREYALAKKDGRIQAICQKYDVSCDVFLKQNSSKIRK